MNYKTIIGLEVHVELKTKSKMFCSCSADYFGKKPNTHTCPVCLGLPGALPVPNEEAIKWCKKIGLALNCTLPEFSKFDRKNYFYPDLPKGYQISQYDKPFCLNGSIEINSSAKRKKIGITRVHMEEDTGKLIHSIVNGKKVSLIDFNRSGVPLVEIVTEPDFETSEEVINYLKKLQQIVRYLEVSDADMEKGEMRLEPNISVARVDLKGLPDYKVEVKNINSFKFVQKAIDFETKRQIELLEKGETPKQETRGFSEKKMATVSQRSKEEAKDYRYFPEPDIPPIVWTKSQIEALKEELPELADEKLKRFKEEYQISEYNAEILTREKKTADYFEETVKVGKEHRVLAKEIANVIINKKINLEEIFPATLVKNILSAKQDVSIDETELHKAVINTISKNQKAIEDYRGGKTQVIGFLIGMVKKELGKPADTNQIKDKLEEELK